VSALRTRQRRVHLGARVLKVVSPLTTIPPAEHSAVGGVWIPTKRGKVVFYGKRHRVFLQIAQSRGMSGERLLCQPRGCSGWRTVVPIIEDITPLLSVPHLGVAVFVCPQFAGRVGSRREGQLLGRFPRTSVAKVATSVCEAMSADDRTIQYAPVKICSVPEPPATEKKPVADPPG
jgi:hypothetical protein